MANTREEISRIHTRKLATPNKKYYRDDGEVFIGTPDRRLRVLDNSSKVVYNSNMQIPQNNINDALNSVNNNILTTVNESIAEFSSTLNNSFINQFLFLG